MGRYRVPSAGVLLPPRVAALFWQHFDVESVRSDARHLDPEVAEVVSDWAVVAQSYLETLRSADGTSTTSDAEQAAQSPRVRVNAKEAARMADATDRGVRKARQEGRLSGEQDAAGQWTFDTNEVHQWASRRPRAS